MRRILRAVNVGRVNSVRLGDATSKPFARRVAGLRIVVDAASLPYLQGMTLDVIDDGLNRRVRFDNPNARHSCGCSESFGV
jgi:iron-sulfur cluster assembly accessory protein